MKRRFLLILTIAAAICCIFALSVSADEIQEYYLVQSLDSEAALSLQAEGKTNILDVAKLISSNNSTPGPFFDTVSDGDSIKLTLAEDIVTNGSEGVGILINKAITVTVVYNGFTHVVPNGSRYSGFLLRNSGAQLNLFGSRAMDENGEFSTKFEKPVVTNNKITTPGNVDAAHNKVYVWVFNGSVYAENMRTSTGQEFVYTESNEYGSYEFKNCACTSGSYSIGLQGQVNKHIKIENGYYVGIQAFTVLTGSYTKNATITGNGISMDCWGIKYNVWEFTNCSISKIATSTGRTHFKLIDCKFDVSTLALGGDGGGPCYALIYTSPTCESDGTLNVYRQGTGTAPDNKDELYASLVTEFYADPQNKAFGHSYGWEYIFDGAKYLTACTAQNICSSCKNITESVNIDAMFMFLGYSVSEFGESNLIAMGIKINSNAIADYEELTGATINYGFVVALKDKLGDNRVPLDANGEAVYLESGNVIKAELSSFKHSYADLMIEIPNAHIDTLLLMSAYITEQYGDSLEISYAQNISSLVENNQFSYISYNTH